MKKKTASKINQPVTVKENNSFLLISLAALAPLLLLSTSTLDQVLWARLISFEVLLLLCSLLLVLQRKRLLITAKTTALATVLVVYALYTLIPLSITGNFADGRIDWLKTATLTGIVILFTFFLQQNVQRNVSHLLKVLLIFSFIACAVGLFQLARFFSGSDVSHAALYQVYSLFAHKNLFSEIALQMLCFSVLSAIYLEKWWRKLSIFLATVSLLFIVILMSRAVWMATLAAIVVTLVALFISKQQRAFLSKKTLLYVAGVSLIIALAVAMYSHFGSESAFQTQLRDITNFNYGTTKDRIELWKKSLDIAEKSPIIGQGQGMWKLQIMSETSNDLLSSDNVTFYQQPHNDLIWVLCEQGFIGLFLYLAVFVIAAFYAVQIARKSTDIKIKAIGITLLAALSGFFAASLFSFPRERIEHLVLFGCILAIINATYSDLQPAGIQRKWIVIGIIAGTIVLSILGLGWSIKRYTAEKQVKALLDARQAQNREAVISIAQSIDSSVCQLDPYTTPINWYRGESEFQLQRTNEAFTSFLSAWRRNPWHVHVLNNLGTCYETLQQHDSALACYGRALQMSPHFNDALLNSAAIRFNQKQYDTAYSLICQLDTTQLNNRSHVFTKTIAGKLLFKMAETEKCITLRNNLLIWSKDDEMIQMLHRKALTEKHTLQYQTLLSFVNLCNNNSISIPIQELGEIKGRLPQFEKHQ